MTKRSENPIFSKKKIVVGSVCESISAGSLFIESDTKVCYLFGT